MACTQVIGVRLPGGPLTITGSWSNGKTPPWRGGNPSSTLGGSTDIRKVAGYGLPGRTANACHQIGDEGSNPLPSAYGSMVKRTSCWASNAVFQVQILVGLLARQQHLTEGHPDWRRDPVGGRLSFAALRVLSVWHQVLMNTETQSVAMRHVAFID